MKYVYDLDLLKLRHYANSTYFAWVTGNSFLYMKYPRHLKLKWYYLLC